MVSSMFLEEGDMLPIMKVLVFMVNDYCNKRVSFDYLKAAMFVFFPLDNV